MGFYLDHYELLYSAQEWLRSRLYGGPCDPDRLLDHGRRRGGTLRDAVLNFFRPRFRAVVIGSGIYVALYLIAVLLVRPSFKGHVQPNELARETPYLKNNIEFTRKAYSLDTIQEHLTSAGRSDFRGDCEKSRHDPERPSLGLAPLLQMYQQLRRYACIITFTRLMWTAITCRMLSPGDASARELSAELPEESPKPG